MHQWEEMAKKEAAAVGQIQNKSEHTAASAQWDGARNADKHVCLSRAFVCAVITVTESSDPETGRITPQRGIQVPGKLSTVQMSLQWTHSVGCCASPIWKTSSGLNAEQGYFI